MKGKKSILSEELLMKFLLKECSEEELRRINAWLNESKENVYELFRLEALYLKGKNEPLSKQEMDRAERRLFDKLGHTNRKKGNIWQLRGYMRYAAACIGLALLSGLSYVAYQQYWQAESLLSVATQNEIKEVSLPDGSKVWLNKHTELKYPVSFDGKRRKVYLEGEGYFEVAKNQEKPFVVQSEAMQVRVLGTVFNLNSDKEKMSAVVTLVQGEIEVKGNHDEGMVVLSPGQKAELDGIAKRLLVKQVKTGIENWHDNTLVFENSDIFTIVRTLEHIYGVKILLSPDIDTEKTYTGAIKKKEDITKSLNLIKNVIPIDYRIEGNNVYLFHKKRAQN